MITPLVMLLLMVSPYLAARILAARGNRQRDTRAAAAAGLSLLFVFTASGHFVQTEPMAQMLPEWVPARVPLVYATGVLELVIAAGFLLPRYRRTTGYLAASVLVLFFPANIYAAINHVPMGGHAWGPIYLLIRAPLQAALVAWVYWFTVRQPREVTT